MIKKIYDRDTGNIYDVGADNKLKLVAEGNIISKADWTIEFDLDLLSEVDENKWYLLNTFYDANGTESSCIIKPNTMSLIVFPDENEEDSPCKVYFSFGYGSSTSISIYSSPDILYGGDTYKLYELPFSM